MLTEYDRERYRRQIILPDFGEECQARLLQSSVLIVGAGGLGSPVALYLAASGIGHIGIIDGDKVDLSNLQRQIIHSEQTLGCDKVDSAAESLRRLNSHIEVTPIHDWLTEENADSIIAPYDFIIDATDSFQIKFLINDVCVRSGKPYSHGAISRFAGQTMTVVPGSACYRCLFDSMPHKTDPVGPLGVLPGVIGVIQATEAIKYIAGIGELLTDTLLIYDALTMRFDRIHVRKGGTCPFHNFG